MIEVFLIAVFVVSNTLVFRLGFKLGIKTEQKARLNRLNSIKKLMNNLNK